MRKTSLFISLILLAQISFGQTWKDTVAIIESIFSRYQPYNPGSQLSIARNGQVIFSKAWGLANLEHNIPLTTNSIIEAGSVSKQFTAAAILLLEQQGKLSMEDDVRKYVPELPDYGTPVKLHHMMHHTSGLKDWGSIVAIAGWPRGTKYYNNDDALEIISRQRNLNNKPGDEFIYSNSNYNLFAIIVRRVSGMSLAAYSQKYIFEPAGMTNTQWRDDPHRIVRGRATAYSKTKTGFQMEMPNEYVYGNGGLLTTTEDLLKWNDFYIGGKLGTSSLLSNQTKIDKFNNGLMNDYGAGLFIQNLMGSKYINHGGATGSYRANLATFPDLNFSIAFLSNSSQFDTSAADPTRSIINLFITDKSEKPAKNEVKFKPEETKLASYAGWYRNNRDGSGLKLSFKDNELIAGNSSKLIPASETSFKLNNNVIDMAEAKSFRYIIPSRDTILYTKVDSTLLPTNNWNVYEGKYLSEETNSWIRIYQEKGKLFMQLKAGKSYELTPTYRDAFIGFGNVQFIRSNRNKKAMMIISIPRARNVEFKRLE